jgi:hypothetical protein
MTSEQRAARAAGVIHGSLGLGFGLGAVWAILHLQRTGELPMTPWGFRALAGPFERLGTGWFSVLGAALAFVCALDVMAGIRLWQGRRDGFALGMATTLPGLVLGLGFALPFLLIGIPARAILALVGRPSLR